MRFVSVGGISGSGKTTLARELSRRLGVPHIELDALNHGPNWTEATPEQLRERVEAAFEAAPDGWVADGNYTSKIGDLVLSRADTFVFLDPPLPVVLTRLARRTATRIIRRTELWNGNRETLRNALSPRHSILVWAATNHARKRREAPEVAAAHPHLTFVRLRSPDDVSRFLAQSSPS